MLTDFMEATVVLMLKHTKNYIQICLLSFITLTFSYNTLILGNGISHCFY
jgi:hypothetical protein